jgi:hypothetical protein
MNNNKSNVKMKIDKEIKINLIHPIKNSNYHKNKKVNN